MAGLQQRSFFLLSCAPAWKLGNTSSTSSPSSPSTTSTTSTAAAATPEQQLLEPLLCALTHALSPAPAPSTASATASASATSRHLQGTLDAVVLYARSGSACPPALLLQAMAAAHSAAANARAAMAAYQHLLQQAAAVAPGQPLPPWLPALLCTLAAAAPLLSPPQARFAASPAAAALRESPASRQQALAHWLASSLAFPLSPTASHPLAAPAPTAAAATATPAAAQELQCASSAFAEQAEVLMKERLPARHAALTHWPPALRALLNSSPPLDTLGILPPSAEAVEGALHCAELCQNLGWHAGLVSALLEGAGGGRGPSARCSCSSSWQPCSQPRPPMLPW